jgi:hypothetical protein
MTSKLFEVIFFFLQVQYQRKYLETALTNIFTIGFYFCETLSPKHRPTQLKVGDDIHNKK